MYETQIIDLRFAVIAVKKKNITRQAYDNALQEQRLLYGKTNKFTLIGDILLNQGAIKKDQRDIFFSFPVDPETHSDDYAGIENSINETITEAESVQETETSGLSEESKDEILLNDNKSPESKVEETTKDREDNNLKKEDKINVTVSEDNLRAYISFYENDASGIDVKCIKLFLEKKGIKNGIVDDNLITTYLNQKNIDIEEPFLVAQGIPCDPGEPDEVAYFFDTKPMRTGRKNEDGSIDWKDRGDIPQVGEGELLAEIKPGSEGNYGIDIFGKKILPPSQNRVRLKKGDGVNQSDDGLKFYSLIKGMPQIYEDGTIDVAKVYKIDGDVDIKIGHIDFDGHIEVEGVIDKGFRVRGRSLRAKGILGSDVIISGDIFVSEGIFSSKIVCNGKMKAGHVHMSDIVLLGDIDIESEIRESKIKTSGKCVVDGTILSSEIYAKKGVRSVNIGSEAAAPSSLTVGIDPGAKIRVDEINSLIEQKEKENKEKEAVINILKKKAEQLSTKLGETAQVQDALMVKKRRLTQTEKGEAKELSASDKEILSKLEAEIIEVDRHVANLMKEDDKVSDDISANEKLLDTANQEIIRLREKIEEIIELSRQEKGVAIVRCSGTVFAGTKIKGVNSSIDIKEDFNRVSIRERKRKINQNQKKWEMSIFSM